MIFTHQNFPNSKIDQDCFCGETETNEHIYHCEFMNTHMNQISYKYIFSDNTHELMEVYNVLKYNLEKREEILLLFEAQKFVFSYFGISVECFEVSE